MVRAHAPSESAVVVKFVLLDDGQTRVVRQESVDPVFSGGHRDTIEHVAEDFVRQDLVLYDTDLHALEPSQCFEAAMSDPAHTIVLVRPEHWNDALTHGILRQVAGIKRPASEDLERRARPRKVQMVGQGASRYALAQDNPWYDTPDESASDSGQ